MSLNAYKKAQSAVQSPREAEYRVFAQVTQALLAAKDHGPRSSEMLEALDWNRRLWSVLSSDCAVAGNGLPQELRAQIVSLSLFVSRFSSDVMRGREEVDTLVEINRSIMEGLAMRSQAETGASPPAPAVDNVLKSVARDV